ncbi:MAG: urease accessory protein UreH [Nitrososphaera sp.]|uniref:urease accessory protein UreH n=1 Tax=Nitrososphaera sp. TaxID=1971748 RepID=UPI003D6E630E
MVLEIFDAMLEPIFSAFQSVEGTIDTAAPAGILLLGLLTGLRHSMEADHVAAVSTTIATAGRKNLGQASMLGALWGLGHTATLFVAALLVLLLAVHIPEKMSGQLEFGVGIMLLFLAVTAFTGFNAGRFFKGLRGRKAHSHFHAHPEQGIAHDHRHDHRHGHKSIIIGMVHGMAGSGALMLVVLSTINSIPLGLAYIAIFGAGSIASMAGISTLIGLPFTRARSQVRLALALKYAAAAVTFVIGAGLVYELGVVEQVFRE